jgi:hypothetical protein
MSYVAIVRVRFTHSRLSFKRMLHIIRWIFFARTTAVNYRQSDCVNHVYRTGRLNHFKHARVGHQATVDEAVGQPSTGRAGGIIIVLPIGPSVHWLS